MDKEANSPIIESLIEKAALQCADVVFFNKICITSYNFTKDLSANEGILICYYNNVIENTRATNLLGAEIIFAPHMSICRHSG